jgi:glycosyltransferase involved in cell wall biosynthesis
MISGRRLPSRLSVVPAARGRHPLEVLEALALGTPVVATPKGAEGLELVDGDEILIGATPAEFARAVVAVLESPALRARLATAGRRRVATSYSWRRIGHDVLQLIDSLTPATGARTEPVTNGRWSGSTIGRGKPR